MDKDCEEPKRLLLTIPQVAESLGISRALVYSLIARKEGIPVIRLGRCVRVSVASLQSWIEQLEQEQKEGRNEQL